MKKLLAVPKGQKIFAIHWVNGTDGWWEIAQGSTAIEAFLSIGNPFEEERKSGEADSMYRVQQLDFAHHMMDIDVTHDYIEEVVPSRE